MPRKSRTGRRKAELWPQAAPAAGAKVRMGRLCLPCLPGRRQMGEYAP